MEYNTIYEASHNHLITTPFIIAIVLVILLTLYAVLNWKHNSSTSGRAGMCIAGVFLLMIRSVTIIKYCSTLKKDKKVIVYEMV